MTNILASLPRAGASVKPWSGSVLKANVESVGHARDRSAEQDTNRGVARRDTRKKVAARCWVRFRSPNSYAGYPRDQRESAAD